MKTIIALICIIVCTYANFTRDSAVVNGVGVTYYYPESLKIPIEPLITKSIEEVLAQALIDAVITSELPFKEYHDLKYSATYRNLTSMVLYNTSYIRYYVEAIASSTTNQVSIPISGAVEYNFDTKTVIKVSQARFHIKDLAIWPSVKVIIYPSVNNSALIPIINNNTLAESIFAAVKAQISQKLVESLTKSKVANDTEVTVKDFVVKEHPVSALTCFDTSVIYTYQTVITHQSKTGTVAVSVRYYLGKKSGYLYSVGKITYL